MDIKEYRYIQNKLRKQVLCYLLQRLWFTIRSILRNEVYRFYLTRRKTYINKNQN